MRDRYWLEKGFYWLLSQRLSCVHQVIWSLRTPAELHRVIVNLKVNSGAHVCVREDARTEMKRWTRQIKLSPSEKTQWTSLPFMSLRYHQVDSFVRFSFVSRFLLLNFLPNSSSYPGMITRPKNVFLQVFNTPSLKRSPSGCFVCALLF